MSTRCVGGRRSPRSRFPQFLTGAVMEVVVYFHRCKLAAFPRACAHTNTQQPTGTVARPLSHNRPAGTNGYRPHIVSERERERERERQRVRERERERERKRETEGERDGGHSRIPCPRFVVTPNAATSRGRSRLTQDHGLTRLPAERLREGPCSRTRQPTRAHHARFGKGHMCSPCSFHAIPVFKWSLFPPPSHFCLHGASRLCVGTGLGAGWGGGAGLLCAGRLLLCRGHGRPHGCPPHPHPSLTHSRLSLIPMPSYALPRPPRGGTIIRCLPPNKLLKQHFP